MHFKKRFSLFRKPILANLNGLGQIPTTHTKFHNKTKFQGDLSASRTPKCWGPKRLVEVPREPGQSLGISIVGGKVEMSGKI